MFGLLEFPGGCVSYSRFYEGGGDSHHVVSFCSSWKQQDAHQDVRKTTPHLVL